MTRPDLPFLLRRKPARARAASLALLALLALPRVTAVDSPVPAPAASFQTFTYAGHDAVFEPPLAPGHFRNPILTGFNPDPSICRVGEDYYLTTSTFAWFPGLPIYHSRDLVNWRLIGHAIDRPRQLDYTGLTVSRGLFAPAITHHDGIFYITCTMVGGGGNFVITATDPAGPWSDPVWLDAGGIDPSLFFDDDGRAWLVNNDEPPEPPR
ncbi:MAG: glycoside hydrolase family 43 protein, partial [Verrucomicrobia bacterium]